MRVDESGSLSHTNMRPGSPAGAEEASMPVSRWRSKIPRNAGRAARKSKSVYAPSTRSVKKMALRRIKVALHHHQISWRPSRLKNRLPARRKSHARSRPNMRGSASLRQRLVGSFIGLTPLTSETAGVLIASANGGFRRGHFAVGALRAG